MHTTISKSDKKDIQDHNNVLFPLAKSSFATSSKTRSKFDITKLAGLPVLKVSSVGARLLEK